MDEPYGRKWGILDQPVIRSFSEIVPPKNLPPKGRKDQRAVSFWVVGMDCCEGRGVDPNEQNASGKDPEIRDKFAPEK